ncbi:MAG: AraC family transcriptional regulator [Mycobacterium sp.]
MEVLDQPASAHEFTTPATSDLLVVMGLQGQFQLESRHKTRWLKEVYRPGTIGVTGPGRQDTLRWRGAEPGVRRTLHVHLSLSAIEEVREELPCRSLDDLDVLGLVDPTATSILYALRSALACESDALVADSLAQALILQVLSSRKPFAHSTKPSPTLTPATVVRVIDYVDTHIHQAVTLDDLAREAHLSKFHFLRAFVGAVGMTPHRYLVEVRMTRAAELLSAGNQTVATVAALCGYSSTARFTAKFRERYGVTPGVYRQERASRPPVGERDEGGASKFVR